MTNTLIYDLTNAFAFPQTKSARKVVRAVFGKAAHSAAVFGMGLDNAVADGGIPNGARWALPYFVKSHHSCNPEIIPPEGPLVFAANHPASIDSIMISAHVQRPDYKIIIGDIPFFEHLPHISAQAIYVPDTTNTSGRMRVIRESIRHLKSGGALLIFPRGGIEPDPDGMIDPGGEFNRWSHSLEIFLEHVPDLQILVTMVSGVIAKHLLRHPITFFRKHRPDRQRLAFLINWRVKCFRAGSYLG